MKSTEEYAQMAEREVTTSLAEADAGHYGGMASRMDAAKVYATLAVAAATLEGVKATYRTNDRP